jgi:stage II sporulation protein AB (anti-sigma F factor)
MQSIGPSLDESYDATPEAVGAARLALAGLARCAGAPPEQVDAVRLAVSEAMTNSVIHAYGGGPGRIRVTAAVAAEELWILIADDGCGLEPRAERPGLGLGLGLIAEVSDELAIVPRAGGGTEVRFRFALGGAALRRAQPAPEQVSARPRTGGGRGPGYFGRPPALSVSVLR